MRPHNAKWKKFKQEPKYPHKRSDGLTKRRNRGSYLQDKKDGKRD